MVKWYAVDDLTEELCTSTMKLAILNYLDSVNEPKTLFEIMGTFDPETYPDLNTDIIDMEDSGLVCRTAYNKLYVTKYGKAVLKDLMDISHKNEANLSTSPTQEPNSADPKNSFESKDAYLKKDGEDHILGVHSVGFQDGDRWCGMEEWVNVYDKDRKFKCSAARICGFAETVKELKDDGWVEIDVDDASEELRKAGSHGLS
jgi:hypothetical protein